MPHHAPPCRSVSAPVLQGTNLNNDNSAAGFDGNSISIDELVFESVGLIDIVFSVADSGGTSEYALVESVFNFGSVTWRDFHLELGFGTGSAFQAAGAGSSGLDFDDPDQDPTPSSNLFATLVHTQDAIGWSGGEIPFGFVDAFFAQIDVPDGITEFTLRQVPTVPEPAAGLLWAAGAAGLGVSRLRTPRRARHPIPLASHPR